MHGHMSDCLGTVADGAGGCVAKESRLGRKDANLSKWATLGTASDPGLDLPAPGPPLERKGELAAGERAQPLVQHSQLPEQSERGVPSHADVEP